MGKRFIALALAILLALALYGCGGADEPEEDPDAEQETAEETAAEAAEDEEPGGWRPDGPVTVIVAYEPGNINDITARVLAQYLESYVGQPIEIVNVPGGVQATAVVSQQVLNDAGEPVYDEAGAPVMEEVEAPAVDEAGEPVMLAGNGSAGWAQLAASEPDGMTIGYVDLPNFNRSIAQQHGLFAADDFIPICTQEVGTYVVVVRASDERFKTLNDLVTVAKAQPDAPLVAATDGERGMCHACTQAFARSAGFTYTPNHRSRPVEALTALRGMAADFCVVRAGDFSGQDSDLRVLGVFGEERLPDYPDVPVLSEEGYYAQWLGSVNCIVAPAGVSDEVVAFYENAFRKAMEDPGYLTASSGIVTDCRDADGAKELYDQLRVFTLGTTKHFWPA